MGNPERWMRNGREVEMGSGPRKPPTHHQSKYQEWNIEALLQCTNHLHSKTEDLQRQKDINKVFRIHRPRSIIYPSSGTLEQYSHSRQGNPPYCRLGLSWTSNKYCTQYHTYMGGQTWLQTTVNMHSHGKERSVDHPMSAQEVAEIVMNTRNTSSNAPEGIKHGKTPGKNYSWGNRTELPPRWYLPSFMVSHIGKKEPPLPYRYPWLEPFKTKPK